MASKNISLVINEKDKIIIEEVAREYGISMASFIKMASLQLAKNYLRESMEVEYDQPRT